MKRKLIIFLLILSLCMFIFSIISTYARYSSEHEEITSINLTEWKFFINNSDIANNSNFTASIVPIFEENPHIEKGIIAPNSTGYFDIELDCSNTNLSFSYSIDINNTNSYIQDFIITGYSKNNGEIVEITDNFITEEILYSDDIDSIFYRFYIKWNDSENNITNNLQDTQLSVNNAIGVINVNVSITQIEDTYNF